MSTMTARESQETEEHLDRDESQDRGSSHEPTQQDEQTAGKPGRKKNPNSQAARRDQNRIAQREFRLRKQQRIRDLEARVEILSGSREESFRELRAIIQDLIKENSTLRDLVKGLSAFLGNGEGGFLPKLGWTWDEFSEFVDRAETDTVFEGFMARRRAQIDSAAQSSSSMLNRKRSFTQRASSPNRKKPRIDTTSPSSSSLVADSQLTGAAHERIYPFLRVASPSSNIWPSLATPDQSTALSNFLDPLRPAASAALGSRTTYSSLESTPLTPLNTSYESVANLGHSLGNSMQPAAQTPISHVRPPSPIPAGESVNGEHDDKIQEAIKLVKYHLDNYRRNDAYCLPMSLRPSLVQRTVPHESIIDEIVVPDLRDSMILLRNRYDLVDCLHDAASALEIHGDDVLAHTNWEFKEPWLRRYSILVEQPLLNTCNRWRRERGEMDLSLQDIKSGESI